MNFTFYVFKAFFIYIRCFYNVVLPVFYELIVHFLSLFCGGELATPTYSHLQRKKSCNLVKLFSFWMSENPRMVVNARTVNS